MPLKLIIITRKDERSTNRCFLGEICYNAEQNYTAKEAGNFEKDKTV